MNKKLISLVMLALLLAVVSGNLFAQSGPKNWVYGQVGLLGGGAGYERVLTPKISIGGEVYWNSLFLFFNSTVIEGYGKYYFTTKGIYGKLGLGYGRVTGFEDYVRPAYTTWYGTTVPAQTYNIAYATNGFAIDPGVGWKIDVGGTGGFYIEPKINVPIVLGQKSYTWDLSGEAPKKEFKVGVNFVVAFAMGYAF